MLDLLPFSIRESSAGPIAHFASGEEANLRHLLGRLVRRALNAAQPAMSMAATIRESGLSLTTDERESLLDEGMRYLRAHKKPPYLDLIETASLLNLRTEEVFQLLESSDGKRMLGYPIEIGGNIRVPRAAIDPASRRDYMDGLTHPRDESV